MDFLPVSDGEIPPGSEKISLNSLYKTFKDTKSHGLVSLHFYQSSTSFLMGILGYQKIQ